jgi:hypothetical protein
MTTYSVQEVIVTKNDVFNFKGICKVSVKNLSAETVSIGLRDIPGNKEHVFEVANGGVFSDREVQISSESGEVKLYMEIQRIKQSSCNCKPK